MIRDGQVFLHLVESGSDQHADRIFLAVHQPILQRGLITVSDDRYLRLKAFSALGQGVKSFFFWTFGPTYIGTENY